MVLFKILLQEYLQLFIAKTCCYDIVVFIEYKECRNALNVVETGYLAIPPLERRDIHP